jgi:hypothetical protein
MSNPNPVTQMPIGLRFVVTAEAIFRRGHFIVAKYSPAPGLSYRVTEVNQAFVSDLFAAGKAKLAPDTAGSLAGAVAGAVKTG